MAGQLKVQQLGFEVLFLLVYHHKQVVGSINWFLLSRQYGFLAAVDLRGGYGNLGRSGDGDWQELRSCDSLWG